MPKKTLKGVVASITGPKTVRVEVVRTFHHPQYRKRVRRTKRYLAHFEGEASVGMSVVIQETAPISKKKRWMVIEAGGKPAAQSKAVEEEKTVKETKPQKSLVKKTKTRSAKK